MADSKFSLSLFIRFFLVGLGIGAFISLLLYILIEALKYCIERKGSPDMNIHTEHESHTPDTPLHRLHPRANLLYPSRDHPAITTVETIPGHALSDMDRVQKSQELWVIEAATLEYLRYTGDSNLITHGHWTILSSWNSVDFQGGILLLAWVCSYFEDISTKGDLYASWKTSNGDTMWKIGCICCYSLGKWLQFAK